MKGLLFTYALTYGGAAVALVNPFVGLLIYVCFAIIKPESLWHWSVPVGNYSRIIAVALLAGWAINGFGNWRFGRAKAVVISLVAFWLWAAVSTITAADLDVALGFLETKGKIVLPFVVGMTLIDSTTKLKALAWTIVLSQGYVAYDLNMSYFDGFNRLQFDGFGGMDNNSFAIALVTGIGMAFFLGLQDRVWWRKLLCFALAALMAHAVFFSFSRGAMLALCVVGGVSFLIIPKRPQHYAWFAFGFVLALQMAGPEVTDRFVSAFVDAEERDGSAQSRLDMWGQCVTLMVENPVLGVGPDHWPMYGRRFGWKAGTKEAHTLWLQTGAEMGFPGLGFLAAFYVLAVWRVWRHLSHHRADEIDDPFIYYVPHMVVSSLAGFIVAAQFVSLEGLEIPYYVTLVAAGTLKLYAGQTATMPALQPAANWYPPPARRLAHPPYAVHPPH